MPRTQCSDNHRTLKRLAHRAQTTIGLSNASHTGLRQPLDFQTPRTQGSTNHRTLIRLAHRAQTTIGVSNASHTGLRQPPDSHTPCTQGSDNHRGLRQPPDFQTPRTQGSDNHRGLKRLAHRAQTTIGFSNASHTGLRQPLDSHTPRTQGSDNHWTLIRLVHRAQTTTGLSYASHTGIRQPTILKALVGQRICRSCSGCVKVTSLDAEFRTHPRPQERPIVDRGLQFQNHVVHNVHNVHVVSSFKLTSASFEVGSPSLFSSVMLMSPSSVDACISSFLVVVMESRVLLIWMSVFMFTFILTSLVTDFTSAFLLVAMISTLLSVVLEPTFSVLTKLMVVLTSMLLVVLLFQFVVIFLTSAFLLIALTSTLLVGVFESRVMVLALLTWVATGWTVRGGLLEVMKSGAFTTDWSRSAPRSSLAAELKDGLAFSTSRRQDRRPRRRAISRLSPTTPKTTRPSMNSGQQQKQSRRTITTKEQVTQGKASSRAPRPCLLARTRSLVVVVDCHDDAMASTGSLREVHETRPYTDTQADTQHTPCSVYKRTLWLACSPPAKANRVQSPAGSLGFSHVGIVPDDAAGRRVFSHVFHFPHTLLNHPHRLSRPRC
ncbi:hypothetical protein PR048_007424 [Dryococelus australis]|uniref:Uncharacterized protein n=1 Tax=Dryococelus australis TaxID=614101 RepID=A0ABQ9HU72_9NEOP|nr:hypothetical protein PR048_007424 [Dryococelus australis]